MDEKERRRQECVDIERSSTRDKMRSLKMSMKLSCKEKEERIEEEEKKMRRRG
jgi:hypothetical protein